MAFRSRAGSAEMTAPDQRSPLQAPNAGMTRRSFLSTVAAGVAVTAGCSRAQSLNLENMRPNILVVLSDSLRADRLGCLGGAVKATPHLDRISQSSLLFEQCYTSSPWTTPATLTFLTGMLPTKHRTVCPDWCEAGLARGAFQVLSTEYKTTAETLKAGGYKTGYFTATVNAIGGKGHERGFDKVWYELNSGPIAHVDAAIDWMQSAGDSPFYAYLHLIDPHEPYQASPERFERLYGQSIEKSLSVLEPREANRLAPYPHLTWDQLFGPDHIRMNPEELLQMSPEAIQHFEHLYMSEIALVDEAIGKLWEWLGKQTFKDETLVVFTADHGESFGEQGHFYHSNSLYDSQLHIPLIIHLPGQNVGARIKWSVGLHDVHPTLLTVAGCAVPGTCQGKSLLARDGSLAVDAHRTILASLDKFTEDPVSWDHAIIEGPLKAMTRPGGATGRVFDREEDPGELNPVPAPKRISGPYHDINEKLRDSLALVGEWAREEAGKPVWQQAAAVDEEALRALGYIQ